MFARTRSLTARLLRRRKYERDLDDELRFHMESRVEDLIRSGLAPAEAERQARMEFGSLTVAKEDCREARGLWWWLDETLRNLSYSIRVLRRSPAFALTAILTLGLCVGANTAIFSVVNAVLLKPLPYPDPDRLLIVATRYISEDSETVVTSQDGRTWEALRDGVDDLERAVYSGWATGVNLYSNGEAQHVQQQRVGSGFFGLLGVDPVIGREFTPVEDTPGGPAVAILGHSLAVKLFGSPVGAVEQSVKLRGAPHLVVGVMPEGFETATPAELWTPLRPSLTGEGEGTNYTLIVRLREGMSLEQARARIQSLGKETIRRSRLPEGGSARLELVPLREGMTESLRRPLAILWTAVALVLLIGCVNVAGLILARSGWRNRETAIRMALGGGRGAVVRQRFAESLVLAGGGALLALLLGYLGKEGLVWFARQSLGIWQEVPLDGWVLGMTAVVALATSLFFGLLPAVQASRVDVKPALVSSSGREVAGERTAWPRRILVISEVALGVVLLVGAGLLIGTVSSLQGLNPGFRNSNLITAKVSLDDARYKTLEGVDLLVNQGLLNLSKIPGVQSAALGLTLPYERALNLGFRPVGAEEWRISNLCYVSPQFFETVGIPVRRGRTLSDRDRQGAPNSIVVNEAFATMFLRDREPVGARISVSSGEREIVGVVGDVQQTPSWGDFGPLGAVPTIYVPVSQTSDAFLRLVHTWFSPTWIIRTDRTLGEMTGELRSAIETLDSELPLFAIRSMAEVMSRSWATQRAQATLLSVLAGLALLLAAVGVYGLVASSVAGRRREVGIRLALGSSVGGAIGRLTLSGVWLAAAGVGIGIVLARATTHLMSHLVWGVETNDLVTFFVAGGVLLLTATLASLIPSLRVLRLNPAQTLRED